MTKDNQIHIPHARLSTSGVEAAMRRLVTRSSHEAVFPGFSTLVSRLEKNQCLKYPELKEQQDRELRKIVAYSYDSIPFYHRLLKRLGLGPEDIKHVEDLEKIPILNKSTIREHQSELRPSHLRPFSYYQGHTSGSTGEPLTYRFSRPDRFLSAALMYRGWGYGGYRLGDRMFFLGGSSIVANTSSAISRRLKELTRNTVMLSSFDMTKDRMHEYVSKINSIKPSFAYGYASSLFFLASWIERNEAEVSSPRAIFATAEMLLPHMRARIEKVFGASVYNTYGLNDGGVSAFECSAHEGLHIDTERSILEVVDEEGGQVSSGQGRIIATSLHNLAMPFIRYDTGDIGILSEERCSCGRGQKLLEDVVGRQQDILVTPEGTHVHGELFSHIFWEVNGVREFQVVQRSVDAIVISIVPDKGFDEGSVQRIKEAVATRSKGWVVDVKLVDKIDRSKGGKYRFVLNEIGDT